VNSRRRVVLAAAVAIAVAVAGCGGSSSSSTTSASSGMTPTAYRDSVNKLCAAYNASIQALPKDTTSTLQGLTTLAGSAKNALAQIKAVSPPAELTQAVNKWIADLESSEANVTKLLAAFKSGHTARLQSLAAEGTKLNAQSNAQARSLGLPSCAENATPSG
jgi:hypothetical protein